MRLGEFGKPKCLDFDRGEKWLVSINKIDGSYRYLSKTTGFFVLHSDTFWRLP